MNCLKNFTKSKRGFAFFGFCFTFLNMDDWAQFLTSATTKRGRAEDETPPFQSETLNNDVLYALDTAITDEVSFNMFALYEQHKDVPFVQDLYKQLQNATRTTDIEKHGYKNRLMVVLQNFEIQRLQREVQEKNVLAREQEKQLTLMRSIVEKVAPTLDENERLKQVCTDLVRIAEEKDKQNAELISNRDKHFEEYETLKKRSKIAVQEEVNAEHGKALQAVKLFSNQKLSADDLIDCMVVFLEKVRLMNRIFL